MKASDLFVKQLEEEGVTHIFGLPGEENLDLLESLRTSSITLILTRHEQAAAFMAATYGRLTGRAGVCFSTLGPGATNLVTGVAHAQLIGAPLVSISGQKAIRENWQARFQLIDVVNLMRPVTKSSSSILDPDTIPTVLRNAFKLAQAERPGAVHVELPEDIAASTTDAPIQRRGYVRRAGPDDRAIVAAAELINRAKYPLIILSSGANRKLISVQLREFVGLTGIYVVHTQMGKGVLSDRSEHSLFATGMHAHDYVNCAIDRADLIMPVGYNIVEYPPYIWNKDLDKKIIHIDFSAAEVDKYYNPDVEVIGDVSCSLRRLGERIEKKDGEIFGKFRRFLDAKLSQGFTKGYPLTPQEIVWHVRNVLSEDDILTLDNGIYKLWFSRLYKTYKPNTFLLDNALATMGAGLPAGIVAKMLYPDRKVLAVVGDGGFMMNSQELETAVRLNIPIVALIVNDNGFGFIKWKQERMGFPSYGLDYSNPDFARYAESYGAVGMRVNKGDGLSEILEQAFSRKRPVLIECPIDYSGNYETFSRELEHLVCEI
ncbi:MAG TPA: acetolactate synthase large subunit [Thermodesulfovibrionales bacterium]|jgi:acetolactate synthase-1/2/3 large subunit|nr:acetolactate synthase large subunit [Thermodesulfovibrionales bacterium]